MKDLNKSLKEIISSIELLPDDDRNINHVMHEGMKHLTSTQRACDMLCPRCRGSKGFYIPRGETWSCLNPGCLNLNAGRKENGDKMISRTGIEHHSFHIRSCFQCFPTDWTQEKMDQLAFKKLEDGLTMTMPRE